jgi:hypothetical protein
MDKQLQGNQQLANITINEELVKALYHVNYLTPYAISDTMLEGWANSIQELNPNITPAILKKIIDKMKMGEIEFDNKKGIQNIFKGYKQFQLKNGEVTPATHPQYF